MGSDDDEATGETPADCLRAWNDDPAAMAFGAHSYGPGHGYRDLRISRRDATGLADAARLAESDRWECVVVLGALILDEEPITAGQVLRAGEWTPLSELSGVDPTRLGEMQAEAAAAPNAALLPDGRLSAR